MYYIVERKRGNDWRTWVATIKLRSVCETGTLGGLKVRQSKVVDWMNLQGGKWKAALTFPSWPLLRFPWARPWTPLVNVWMCDCIQLIPEIITITLSEPSMNRLIKCGGSLEFLLRRQNSLFTHNSGQCFPMEWQMLELRKPAKVCRHHLLSWAVCNI